jgi:glucokinase
MTAILSPSSPINDFAGGPRLLADVGGTNARFALETAPGRIVAIDVLPCADYPTLAAALLSYLGSALVAETCAVGAGGIRHGAIAIANPVIGDMVRMTNHHWAFSIEALRQEVDFDTLLVVNDFTALASALPFLSDEQKRQVGKGVAVAGTPLGLIGAGTGLGVSGLIPGKDGWTALLSEGGHVSFAPVNPTEVAILQFAWKEFEHVSAERLMSGAGIELIYRALADQHGVTAEPLTAADISRRALSGDCALCDEVIEAFCCMLGTIASNLVVTLGAQGGIYIGGGIVPRLGERFGRSGFRARFEHKGRFHQYLTQVPTWVITADYPAFVGVSAILSERLAAV